MWVPCLWDEWQWVSLSQTAPPGIPGDLPGVTSKPYQARGYCLVYHNSPLLMGPYWSTRKWTQRTRSAPHPGTQTRAEARRLGRLGQLWGNQLSKERTRLPWSGGKARLPVMWVGRTWSAWQTKSALLASETLVRTDVALPQGGRGMLGSGGLPGGTLVMANFGLLPAAKPQTSQRPSTSVVLRGKSTEL